MMIKKNLYRPFEVEYRELENCPLNNIKYSFFQMVYVLSGKGMVTLNKDKTPYRTGSLLLFVPDDNHTLDIYKKSEVLLIRFNQSFFKEYNNNDLNNLQAILYHAPHLHGCVLKNKSDEAVIKSIMQLILQEINHTIQNKYNELIVLHLVSAIITITARNIVQNEPIPILRNSDTRIQKIIFYLQENIHCPNRLRAENISNIFGISQSYLSNFFKIQSGETLQNFISKLKFRLIEQRLKYTDKRINEIAYEFGFSDESHLNKFFKKHKGISLTGFRKQWVNKTIIKLKN